MNLDDLLENSGVMEKQPAPPPKGIPRRFTPFFIRWPIKAIILPFIWLDSLAQWVAKLIVPPPFVKAGQCKKRGNCCYHILVRKTRAPFGFLDLFWHTQINGFYRREKKAVMYDGKPVYVMGCRYLKKNGACSRYLTRPQICRSWPRIEIFGAPEILKGCGFYPKERKKHPLNILK
ncbi:MAG: hypothetical protein S4CHLAM20_14900 [Chlamydiia bacterium]|nr:hypothetical protein [Chlamydiia bacterium]